MTVLKVKDEGAHRYRVATDQEVIAEALAKASERLRHGSVGSTESTVEFLRLKLATLEHEDETWAKALNLNCIYYKR